MKSNSVVLKKDFEEEDELCNFQKNDISDGCINVSSLLKNNDNKSRNSNEKERKKSVDSKKSEKKKKKMNKSAEIERNESNSNLVSLLDKLKIQISKYEAEIRSLLDEKVQMQITINNLQVSNYQTLRKSAKSTDNFLAQSQESINDLNKQYLHEASGLRAELGSLGDSIKRQRELLEQNEDLFKDEGFSPLNLSPTNPQRAPSKFKVNEEKENLTVESLLKQREFMMEEINSLKNELLSLIALQQESNTNDKEEPEVEEEDQEISVKNINAGNITLEPVSQSNNTTNNNLLGGDEDILPVIETFFMLNSKILLVDSEKALWHIKRCSKYDAFLKGNSTKFQTKEEVFNAFIEEYQKVKKLSTLKNEEKAQVAKKSVQEKDIHLKANENISDNSFIKEISDTVTDNFQHKEKETKEENLNESCELSISY